MTALLTPTAYTIDSWDPSYGVSVGEELDGRASTAKVDPDVEVPAAQWRPITPDRNVALPSAVLFLDGVRRIDAHAWVPGIGQLPEQGLVASLAAGLVCCNGVAEVIGVKIDRSVYSPVETATDLVTAHAKYTARLTKPGPNGLMAGVQRRLAELEAELSAEWRERGTDDDLLVMDGPVHEGVRLPRTVGYVKTHRASYLDAQRTEIVTSLAAGQRSPVFAMGTEYGKHSWYLRLPGAAGNPWSAIVRLECSPGLPIDEVVALADVTSVVLPGLASTPHKDPRAPQNLVPIGGLERLLRHRLGDAALLYRSLRSATLRALDLP